MLVGLALWLIPALCATLRGQINDLEDVDMRSTAFILRDIDTAHRERHDVTTNGTFEFFDLAADKNYLLTLDSDSLELPWSYLVTPKSDGDFNIHKVTEGRPLDSVGPSVGHPITITGYKRAQLVVDRANFSVIKFFTQPTVLLSLGALLLVTYLPSWIQDMDPELLEELRKNQIQGSSASEKLQNFDLAKSIADRRAQKE